MYDELLFTVNGEAASKVQRRSMEELELEERKHLQEWVLANPEVLGPGVLVITSEFDRWQSADGAKVADRLDILAMDAEGHLVVVELKRGYAPHTVHMQAINYAAMVSRLTPEDIAELYARSETKAGRATDADAALDLLTTEHLLSAEGIRSPRIVLIASDFPPAVTASVVWLNEQTVSISLIRFRAYKVAEQIVVSFSRLYPVPDVEEFTIGRRADPSAVVTSNDPGEPWDEAALRQLAEQGNDATLALLDLCAAGDANAVGVQDIALAAGITKESVRGQLAGLTMRLKNPRYGFAQNQSPAAVTWLPGGVASYAMDAALAEVWRTIRGDDVLVHGESAATDS